ncbi:50S ribosomal protein L11 methyltransferase [Weissella koreensis]|uniref:Ribosomal protein L11 methyltransferase n=1 Tax=Weissella koreensis TaxID=165096 RepID=A0A7H1MKJ4_9LACO|nr:50S ribosomal protein L11 methyltransferase [Weissella koreensis]AEJ23131.1 ribosomal protein L11 methyltransferase [Weissella koreensis KACC 15510]AVH74777.1 50S ribosomal protein L11 methyltransferase [Weissella koreensis]MCZ9310572.1 50S ribosomal protein L11 methyltransferase [Weissella koreensis]QGN20002.1 50S ribosomal protein L11 methyltransferase [Weissella koreensis]QNT63980.1 50S ribosomal protein L11 methyltransferase [Weissella koreensis]
MSWHTIEVETQTEAVDAVSNILMEAGAEGVQIEDSADVDHFEPNDATVFIDWDDVKHRENGALVIGFFAFGLHLPEITLEITNKVQQLNEFGLDAAPGTVTSNVVLDQDWETEWQKYYHPVRVTRQLTIVPKWEEYTPQDQMEKLIVLDPGLAFGTGTHPTTKLMLQALEMVVRGNERVLDVGTGSGVLSIAAKQLGVGDILATDIDEVAVRSAQTNLDLNPIAKDVSVIASDLLKSVPKTEKYNLVVANMLTEVLLPLIPEVEGYLQPGGDFLLSGIYFDKIEVIKTNLVNANYAIDEVMQIGDWYGVIAHLKIAGE